MRVKFLIFILLLINTNALATPIEINRLIDAQKAVIDYYVAQETVIINPLPGGEKKLLDSEEKMRAAFIDVKGMLSSECLIEKFVSSDLSVACADSLNNIIQKKLSEIPLLKREDARNIFGRIRYSDLTEREGKPAYERHLKEYPELITHRAIDFVWRRGKMQEVNNIFHNPKFSMHLDCDFYLAAATAFTPAEPYRRSDFDRGEFSELDEFSLGKAEECARKRANWANELMLAFRFIYRGEYRKALAFSEAAIDNIADRSNALRFRAFAAKWISLSALGKHMEERRSMERNLTHYSLAPPDGVLICLSRLYSGYKCGRGGRIWTTSEVDYFKSREFLMQVWNRYRGASKSSELEPFDFLLMVRFCVQGLGGAQDMKCANDALKLMKMRFGQQNAYYVQALEMLP